ncbi:MAG: hypothetical protein KCHDKBKB_02251 [Elusimicrobia bacterium]|nr:hypothetical protein [Elusimicrobiota bacterium]
MTTKAQQEEIKKAVQQVVRNLMERVMENTLKKDPFIVEEHRMKKPLYAVLVPDEIFKGSHFERKFVTPFGKVWEGMAFSVAKVSLGFAEMSKSITGMVKKERLRRISEVLATLEHSTKKGTERVRPNWDNEIAYIMEGMGHDVPTTVICDLYAEDKAKRKKYAFEIKAPLPNSDQTKVSKEKILKLYCMEEKPVDQAFFALPYNPFGTREKYNWSFPFRWFDMRNDKAVLIGNDFWDLLGGEGTYKALGSALNEIGKEYKEIIYREYLQIIPPESSKEFSL